MKTFAIVLSLFVSTAVAAPFDDFKFATPERFDISADVRYYLTDANFDKTGNTYTKLPSGYSYQLTEFNFGARTRLAPKWHLYGGSTVAVAKAGNPLTGTKSNSGFSQAVIGTDLVMLTGKIMLIPDFSFTVPLVNVNRTGTEVANSEGAMEFAARLVARIERRNHRFGFYTGAIYRDKGRSMLLPYGVLGEVSFGEWNFGTDLRGYQSIANDKDTNTETTADASYFCPTNGCSKRFAAINPALLQSNTWVRWNVQPNFAAYGSASVDVGGSNTSRGYAFIAGLIFRLGTRASATPPPINNDFQEYTDDGVDQRHFQGNRSMTPPVVPPKGTKPGPSRPAGPPKPNLQEELNKTEMQIDTKPDRNEDL